MNILRIKLYNNRESLLAKDVSLQPKDTGFCPQTL